MSISYEAAGRGRGDKSSEDPPKTSQKAPQAPGLTGTGLTRTLGFPKGQATIFGERPVTRARASSIRPLHPCGWAVSRPLWPIGHMNTDENRYPGSLKSLQGGAILSPTPPPFFGPGRLSSVLFSDHLLVSNFDRFWVVLGCHLEFFFRPCWRPSSAKTGPKRVSKAYQYKKR